LHVTPLSPAFQIRAESAKLFRSQHDPAIVHAAARYKHFSSGCSMLSSATPHVLHWYVNHPSSIEEAT